MSDLFDRELAAMPDALRKLADNIQSPDHVPAMRLRDAAAMIEALKMQRDQAREDLRAWMNGNIM